LGEVAKGLRQKGTQKTRKRGGTGAKSPKLRKNKRGGNINHGSLLRGERGQDVNKHL